MATVTIRMKNLLTKLANGDDLFTNDSPVIRTAEIAEIERLTELPLQRESLHGASPGPRLVYVMDHHKRQFMDKVQAILEPSED